MIITTTTITTQFATLETIRGLGKSFLNLSIGKKNCFCYIKEHLNDGCLTNFELVQLNEVEQKVHGNREN